MQYKQNYSNCAVNFEKKAFEMAPYYKETQMTQTTVWWDSSQSESDGSCLETGCLPTGDLCNHLTIESGHPEVACSASGEPVDAACSCLPKVTTGFYWLQSSD